jgi:hypothetical protein
MNVQRNIKGRSRNQFCHGYSVNTTYCDSVFVLLPLLSGMKMAPFLRVLCIVCDLPHFSTYRKQVVRKKKKIEL